MKSAQFRNFLWPVAGAIIAITAFLWVALRFVRLPPAPAVPPKAAQTAAIVISQQKANDTTSLFSHGPLFLSTPLNASRLELPAEVHQEPTAMFHNFDPKYTFSVNAAAIVFPEPFAHRFLMPNNPAAATLIGEQPNPYAGIGRILRPATPLPSRLGSLEVAAAATGRVVLTSELAVLPLPRALPSSWQPFQLMVSVDETGLVAEPLIVTSSGVSDVDAFFRTFLAKTFQLGKRLEPGIYRLRVGP